MRALLKILFILPVFFCFQAESQKKINWGNLSEVKFEQTYFEDVDEYYLTPTFSDNIKKLDGKVIIIKGFLVPINEERNLYALSANSYQNCYFCSKAGPETVMELIFAKEYEGLGLDQVVTVQGKLRLNSTDIYEMNYVLENVTILE